MTKERNKMKTTNETPILRRLGRFASAALSANKTTVGVMALLLGGGLAALAAGSGNDNRAPEVPDDIKVPVGNKVHFHGFGVGVQIYTWNGSSWGAAVPEAILFHAEGIVTIHFAGPTWMSNSGSTVVGALPPKAAVTVDPSAIPWLLLSAKSKEGPGIFADTTYIQRVNTTGGKAPLADGTFVGQVARVPYTADYIFYRQTKN
jgi:hypothetical protein